MIKEHSTWQLFDTNICVEPGKIVNFNITDSGIYYNVTISREKRMYKLCVNCCDICMVASHNSLLQITRSLENIIESINIFVNSRDLDDTLYEQNRLFFRKI